VTQQPEATEQQQQGKIPTTEEKGTVPTVLLCCYEICLCIGHCKSCCLELFVCFKEN
jgi:hypothetical protein